MYYLCDHDHLFYAEKKPSECPHIRLGHPCNGKFHPCDAAGRRRASKSPSGRPSGTETVADEAPAQSDPEGTELGRTPPDGSASLAAKD